MTDLPERPALDTMLGTDRQAETHKVYTQWITNPSTTLRDIYRAGVTVSYRPEVPAFAATGGEWALVDPRTRNGVTMTHDGSPEDGLGLILYGSGLAPTPCLQWLADAMPDFAAAHSLPFSGLDRCAACPVETVAGWYWQTTNDLEVGESWGESLSC